MVDPVNHGERAVAGQKKEERRIRTRKKKKGEVKNFQIQRESRYANLYSQQTVINVQRNDGLKGGKKSKK